MRYLAACLLGLFLASHAAAAPRHIDEDLDGARLVGSGVFRYFGLQIYSAQLWSSTGAYDPVSPFVLELCYLRSLDGKEIAAASTDAMSKLAQGSASQRAQWSAAMARLFPDVRNGDCISGHARMGAATRFYLNGTLLGRVDDPAFSSAFFAIWLAPQSSKPALRAHLLGQRGR